MPIFTANKRPRLLSPVCSAATRQRGFTLVELLVVLALLGAVASLVIIQAPRRDARAVRAAQILAGEMAAIRDRAVTSGRPAMIWMGPSGYGFQEYRDGQWVPLGSGVAGDNAGDNAGARPWPRGVIIAAPAGMTRRSFDTVGLPDAPLTAILQSPSGSRASVQLDAGGAVRHGP